MLHPQIISQSVNYILSVYTVENQIRERSSGSLLDLLPDLVPAKKHKTHK
jgi:hypothetical protein